MAQFDPEPNYDHRLAERIVLYLQTRDSRLFPFSTRFDADQHRAFVRDLRSGLAEITDSGSARKSSATGFVMSDARLQQIVNEWTSGNGGWPQGTHPRNPDSALNVQRGGED